MNGAGNRKGRITHRPGGRGDHQAYLGLGSNIDAARNLPRAITFLGQQARLEAFSVVWETPPEGTRGVNFLNAAVLVHTPLTAGLLKSLVLRPIEARMGRVRTANKNAPRPIDLDILVFDGQAIDPKIWNHAFVAVPLAELVPELINPETGERLQGIAQRLAESTPLKPRLDVDLRLSAASDR